MAAIPVNVLVPLKAGIDLTQIFVNVTIIYISVRYLKPNLCMMYALNHSIPSLVYIIFSAILGLTDLSGAGRTAFYQGSTPYVEDRYNWANFVDSALSRYVANSYKVFATLMVLLTYISYVYPLFYAKIISKRNMPYVFLSGHLIVAFLVGLVQPNSIEAHFLKNSIFGSGLNPLRYIFLTEKLLGFLFFLAMIVLYALSIHKIIQFSKKQPTSSSARRRSQLISVLIYCTPPNIFLAVGQIRNACIAFADFGFIDGKASICQTMRYFHGILLTTRFFVSAICTLIAFNDYRKILADFVKRLVGIHTAVVYVKSISSLSKNS